MLFEDKIICYNIFKNSEVDYMNTTELLIKLEKVKDSINDNKKLKAEKRKKYNNILVDIINEYKNINIAKEFTNVYKSLIKNGDKLIDDINKSDNTKELIGKIDYYIRYLKAAKADFTGKVPYLGKYYRSFIITSALFLALSPQYYGFILAVIFFVPIILGIKGIKNRSKTGFQLSLSVVPVALMTSFTWLRYGIYALSNFQAAVNETIQTTGYSAFKAQLLIIIPQVLALILLVYSLIMLYRAYKSRNLFV